MVICRSEMGGRGSSRNGSLSAMIIGGVVGVRGSLSGRVSQSIFTSLSSSYSSSSILSAVIVSVGNLTAKILPFTGVKISRSFSKFSMFFSTKSVKLGRPFDQSIGSPFLVVFRFSRSSYLYTKELSPFHISSFFFRSVASVIAASRSSSFSPNSLLTLSKAFCIS